MSGGSFARPAMARENVRESLRLAAVAAARYAAALLDLESPGSSVLALDETGEALLLRCRDVARAVEGLAPEDRPEGWDS